MIRVAIVDDHPAVRLGLQTALAAEPGVSPVGAASSAAELGPLLYRTDPDVVLLDYQLPDGDGLALCREIKAAVPSRRVILYSAFADASMTVPAIRAVAAGGDALPPVYPVLLEAAGVQLDAEDVPILSMFVNRTSCGEIATTLSIGDAGLAVRVRRMLRRLKPVGSAHGEVA